jgi:hypothetical protein
MKKPAAVSGRWFPFPLLLLEVAIPSDFLVEKPMRSNYSIGRE